MEVREMILFVCSQGRIRSFSARNWAILGGLDAEACGTDRSAKITVTDNLLRCADKVFCMEYEHKKKLSNFAHYDEQKVRVLSIEDIYNPLDEELNVILVRRMLELEQDGIAAALKAGFERGK